MYAIVTTLLDSIDEEGVTSKVPHYTVVSRIKGRDLATFLTREEALAYIKSLI